MFFSKMGYCLVFLCLAVSFQRSFSLRQGSTDYEDMSFWMKSGQKNLQRVLGMRNVEKRAKNIIIFIGDGMGMASITSGRILTGQRKGLAGEEYKLIFEEFPNTGFSKTYNVDKQVPDSAGTATAIFSGVKSRYKVIGLDAKASYNSCDATVNEARKLTTLADWAQATGMDTGFVTTTRITHATPAALYAHVNNRDWECNSNIPREYKNCAKDIARQLVEDTPGNKFKVIMGGGGQNMGHPVNDPLDSETCVRDDGKDLTAIWKDFNPQGKFVTNASDLMSVDIAKASKLLGIFASSHMPYHEVRTENTPTLANMTLQAIRMLRKSKNGFFLMVESGKIDIAHHQNYARLALREVTELEEAVKISLSQVNIEETLIIVTADHSHSFTMNGYPERGNDIFGLANNKLDPTIRPYETLTYANGPGFMYHRLNSTNSTGIWRPVEDDSNREKPFYRFFSPMYLKDDTHGGEDVGVYAIGPYSHLFRGTFEQNYIAHAVAYASCLKDWPSHCDRAYNRFFYEVANSSRSIFSAPVSTVILTIFLAVLRLT
ncbi:alkaline phosphatase 4 isoform X1 [Diachasma alloeum]|uniref:alkaline phosphatase 4 isoform X1 n=2 Tax=Diachasma alloeum TaxID=454923 RepID=UPI00073827E9|nr:alkaline phosphatase 4 isoform X1 [Diachasma alloeum]